MGGLCGFLGLERKGDYLEDCASLVFDTTRKSRHDVEWDASAIAAAQEGVDRHVVMPTVDWRKGKARQRVHKTPAEPSTL